MNRVEYDPIAVEIHRKALENLTAEAALAMVHTSGSPTATYSKDFSTCFLDAEGEQLGFASYILAHSASSWLGTRKVIEHLRAVSENPQPGDGWIVNDPYVGGALHQGDVGVITPTFFEGMHAGWAFANMHVADVGGSGVSGFAPEARSVYEEGMRFPLLRVIRGGRLDPEWERCIEANVRSSSVVLNDIRGMIAANNVAQIKQAALIGRFGLERHREYCEITKQLTEDLLRRRISGMLDGTYESVDWVEYDGHGRDRLLLIRCRMTVVGSDLCFDFEAAPQIDGYVNACEGAVFGCVMTSILTTLAYGDLPFNAGMWRPISISLGEPGTIVNAVPPAPVSSAHGETGGRVVKLVKDLLTQALSLSEEPALRARVAGQAQDGSPTAGLFGMNQFGRQSIVFHMDMATGKGGGAQSFMDGQDCYGGTMMAGCGLPDVEAHEANDPVVFLWRRIDSNSGGPGMFRGGQGIDQAYVLYYGEELSGFVATLVSQVPPIGAGGGLVASASAVIPIRNSNIDELIAQARQPVAENLKGTVEKIPNKVGHFTIYRGDVMRFRAGGGGGVGDPLLRDPDLVARDVRDGYITEQNAWSAYGVILDEHGEPLPHATDEQRRAIRTERVGRTPPLELRAPADVGISLVCPGPLKAEWVCASCGTSLCDARDDWKRTGTVLRSDRISRRLEEWDMRVRDRANPPSVLLREYFCPGCAMCLGMDVTTEDVEIPVPRLVATANV